MPRKIILLFAALLGEGLHQHPGNRAPIRRILHHEQHLRQRSRLEARLVLQPLEQSLKRQILVRERLQRDLAHLVESHRVQHYESFDEAR